MLTVEQLTFLARIVRKDTITLQERLKADEILKGELTMQHISNTSVYLKAIETFGQDHQLIKAMEEAGEYIQAIAKYLDKRDDNSKNDLLGEMADIMVTLNQLKLITGITDVALFRMVDFKTRRLAERIGYQE